MKALTGVIPPMLTLFDENGDLAKKEQFELIDFLIDSKVDAIFILGTAGEFVHLSAEERKSFTEGVISYVNGRIPVLVGTAATRTSEVIELTIHAEKAGAHGAVIINPYFWSLSEDNLLDHYGMISQAAPELPLYLYNIPVRTGQSLTTQQIIKLIERSPNIVGMKDTSWDPSHAKEVIFEVKSVYPHFSVLAGVEETFLHLLNLGADGVIPATANFSPELAVGVNESYKSGDFKRALELTKQLAILSQIFNVDEPPIAALKEALYLKTGIKSYSRKPARTLSEQTKQQVSDILRQIK